MIIKEIYCKSILSKSRIYGVNYAINPYLGCMHGCLYCYARYTIKNYPEKLEWGTFVYPKINAPTILIKELRKHKPGTILISSVTDPYQLIEAKYMLTRRILKIISNKNFSIIILTKSDLILRDLDLLKKISELDAGLTIITLDENIRRIFEPKAPSIIRRLNTIKRLVENNIRTYAFLGPIIPVICEKSIEKLIEKLAQIKVNYIVFDKLNIRGENWRLIERALRIHYPLILDRIKNIMFNRYDEYYEDLKVKVKRIASKFNLDVEFCY